MISNLKFSYFFLLIIIIGLTISLIICYRNNSKCNENFTKVKDTISKFQKALQNQELKTIEKLYYDNKSHIITNRPFNFSNSVLPKSNDKDIIKVGTPITGIDNLKKYQEYVFKHFDLTHLTSKIISMNVYDTNATATVYGTHKVFKKNPDGTLDKSKQINVQAQEIWNLKKKNNKYYVDTVAFIDHNHIFDLK